jgi:hypothetical protein
LIARLNLPLNIGKQSTWGDYIRIAHNPNYKQVSRKTTTRDAEALFYRKLSYWIIELSSMVSLNHFRFCLEFLIEITLLIFRIS